MADEPILFHAGNIQQAISSQIDCFFIFYYVIINLIFHQGQKRYRLNLVEPWQKNVFLIYRFYIVNLKRISYAVTPNTVYEPNEINDFH